MGASLDVKVEGVGALRGVWHVVQGADALIAPILKYTKGHSSNSVSK